ncbi:MAG: type II toxin-antitoxin system PemK/MazF family toxin [Planctomycetota bacterium]
MTLHRPQEWDIRDAPWPDEPGGTKLRPVMILGSRWNGESTVFVACKITHTLRQRRDRFTIEEADDGFELTGLDDTSHAHLMECAEFASTELKVYRGALPESLAELVAEALLDLI